MKGKTTLTMKPVNVGHGQSHSTGTKVTLFYGILKAVLGKLPTARREGGLNSLVLG